MGGCFYVIVTWDSLKSFLLLTVDGLFDLVLGGGLYCFSGVVMYDGHPGNM